MGQGASAIEVRLRPVAPADLEAFFADQADPIACAMAGFASRARDAFFAHWAKNLAEPTNRMLTVLADGAVAGNVVAWGPTTERAVGYWIARRLWGRGIATAALARFVALETTRPLVAHVARHNPASRRVLVKCGFVEVPAAGTHGDDAGEVVMRLDCAPQIA